MLKDIGGPYQREYPVAVAEGLIEPGIKPLTDALFEASANPLASCEGHSQKTQWGILAWLMPTLPKVAFRPYAMFSAPEQYARAFQKCYDRLGERPFYNWWITGHFHPQDYELVWTVEPIDIRLKAGDVDHLRLLKDIQALACVAREASRAANGFH